MAVVHDISLAFVRLLLTSHACLAYDLHGLGARVDNEYIRVLEADPEQMARVPNRATREVSSGHFVLVRPTPIRSPSMVTYSEDVCTRLLRLDEATCRSELFVKLFSGGHIEDEVPAFATSWATPYALSIYGEEVQPNGAGPRGYGYGDGRAISIGEIRVDGSDQDSHWELQLKGSGKTPFSRNSDGRAVLRSSLREFVASEAMAAMRVPTTRALSLVVSASERVQRPWYANASAAIAIGAHRAVKHGGDLMQSERVAITTRVSRSFLRVGQFELYGRRASRAEPDGLRQLEMLARFALRREYSDQAAASPSAPLQPQLLAMARAASTRFARLAAEWLRVGFTQSNYNADNSLIGGATVDYGPFGFLEKFEKGWGMWIGSGSHFAFLNQPVAAGRNLGQFVKSLEPLVDASGVAELRRIASEVYTADSELANSEMWAAKLGLAASSAPRAAELWAALLPLLEATPTDWTLFWRQLASVADAAADGVAESELVGLLLSPACYQPLVEEPTRRRWLAWLRSWLQALDAEAAREEAGERLRRANPKYVPREWMLVEAYTAADRGDYGPLHTLTHLLSRPYDEQPEMAERFYRRAPPGAHLQGGIGFMS